MLYQLSYVGERWGGAGCTGWHRAPSVARTAGGFNSLRGGAAADAQASATELPAGAVVPFAGPVTAVPSGYLLCDGSTISRTDYATLYAVIGNAWGEGDGSTTFHLPDLRGRFLRGVDDPTGAAAAGLDPDAASRTASNAGGNTGNMVGSAQGHALLSHEHDILIKNEWLGGCGYISSGGCSTTGFDTDHSTFDAQPTGDNETRPKNAYVNYIVKY